MKRVELEKRLKRAGWRRARHGRRHDVWTDGERQVYVPRHPEIREGTAQSILRKVEEGRDS